MIPHEKKTPKATSVTSGVTLTDRVQSGGLTGRLLAAAAPTTAHRVFGAESDKVGYGFPEGAPGNNGHSRRYLVASCDVSHELCEAVKDAAAPHQKVCSWFESRV